LLKRTHGPKILHSFTGLGAGKQLSFAEANEITQFILDQFTAGGFDVCTLIYNNFKSVLTQTPRAQQLIPFKMEEPEQANDNAKAAKPAPKEEGPISPYTFEPEEEE